MYLQDIACLIRFYFCLFSASRFLLIYTFQVISDAQRPAVSHGQGGKLGLPAVFHATHPAPFYYLLLAVSDLILRFAWSMMEEILSFSLKNGVAPDMPVVVEHSSPRPTAGCHLTPIPLWVSAALSFIGETVNSPTV